MKEVEKSCGIAIGNTSIRMFCKDAMSEKWQAIRMGRTIPSAKLFARDVDVFSTLVFGPRNTAAIRNAAIPAIANS